MFYFFLRKFRRVRQVVRRSPWTKIIITLGVLHVASAVGLLVLDPVTFAEDTWGETLWKGTWWFFVTATTVGYGDVVPQTMGGQALAIVDMIFGIGLMFSFMGLGVDSFVARRQRRMKGLHTLNIKNHIVILGGGAFGKLHNLVHELRSDPLHSGVDIVVCSKAYEENPIPAEIRFIHGEISSVDVLTRACVDKASIIIVYGYTDNETIMTAMAVDEINRSANVTVYLRDRENSRHIDRINHIRRQLNELHKDFHSPEITSITRINDLMLAREVSNPDLSSVILELVTEKRGNTFYSMPAWPDMDACVAVGRVRELLRDTSTNALLIGFKRHETGELVINADDETFICPRDLLFIIALKRPKVDWQELLS
ncbi:MAG: NAD-binding protein [Desulfovibrionaceae bacterium]|jgi:voltage-gated potassium channel|nr:NAD-binding protein [Desulfovibrionaceae bacterium]